MGLLLANVCTLILGATQPPTAYEGAVTKCTGPLMFGAEYVTTASLSPTFSMGTSWKEGKHRKF